jgi:hypothetical protein
LYEADIPLYILERRKVELKHLKEFLGGAQNLNYTSPRNFLVTYIFALVNIWPRY